MPLYDPFPPVVSLMEICGSHEKISQSHWKLHFILAWLNELKCNLYNGLVTQVLEESIWCSLFYWFTGYLWARARGGRFNQWSHYGSSGKFEWNISIVWLSRRYIELNSYSISSTKLSRFWQDETGSRFFPGHWMSQLKWLLTISGSSVKVSSCRGDFLVTRCSLRKSHVNVSLISC